MNPTLIPMAALSFALLAAVTGCSGDNESKESGTCGDHRWELTAETEKGTTEIAFELRTSAPAETWQVVIEQDGTSILEGTRATDEDAELDAETSVPSSDDESTFTVTATPPTGEPCTAEITH